MSDGAVPVDKRRPTLAAWLPILAGLLLVYLPSFVDLFNGVWNSDRNAHGPIVLAVSIWFLGFRLKQLLAASQIFYNPAPVAGASLIGFGLVCYVLGRSQSVLVLEIGSFVPVVAGCVVLFFGARSLVRLWFAFFFMLFFIPLPASLVDAVTQPLKIGVSYTTEHLLYWAGYPIAREGVILILGQYQLLVADACAGLHSLFTLEALGLLYMNIVGHQSVARNAMLAVLIVPISFIANVLRVIALALITYYLGDAAGQGFLHTFAGMLLFLSALIMIFGVDSIIGKVLDPRRQNRADALSPPIGQVTTDLHDAPHSPGKPHLLQPYFPLGIGFRPAFAVATFMIAAAVSARALTPDLTFQTAIPDLAGMIPVGFREWKEIPSPYVQIDLAARGEELTMEQPYDAVLMRSYVNANGDQVMLALAYARQQRQDVKIHRPEVCYTAQGFSIVSASAADFKLGQSSGTIPGMRLITRNRARVEAVSYWIRLGDAFPRGAAESRWHIFREGLAGRVPDGILVRVSTVRETVEGANREYPIHERFLDDLLRSLPSQTARMLASSGSV